MRIRLMILSFAVLVLIFTGCEDTFEDLFSSKNDLTVYVYDVDTWTPENPMYGDDVIGASVKLLDINNPKIDSPLYEKISEWDGNIESDAKVKFNKIPDGEYILYVVKGDKTNIIEKEIINGEEVGFVIDGIIQTQVDAEISNQPNAYVGGPVLKDFNGDEMYDANDKRVGKIIEVKKNASIYAFIAEDN